MARDDVAMLDGKILPMDPDEARETADRIVLEGTLIAAVYRSPEGDLSVQVYGPPSLELLACLKAAAKQYAALLRGH